MSSNEHLMCFPTINDERELKSMSEIAREGRMGALDEREKAGENVDAERKTEGFFKNLADGLGRDL